MGLLNSFSKWKITHIILFPVQKDTELLSLFIQYKTMDNTRGILQPQRTLTQLENYLDHFHVKVTFPVIKTCSCGNDGEAGRSWDGAQWGIVK